MDLQLTTSRRLRRGHLLVPTDGDWLLYQPDDSFARLRAEPGLLARLADCLNGGDAGECDLELAKLLDALAAQGWLEDAGETRPDLSAKRVAVRGEGRIAGMVAELMREAGVGEVRREPDGARLAAADAIVACAGWLPDARWRALDAWCAERGVPWHGCYAEGTRFYLGPLALPGRTACYADVRARRLAASRNPEELLALWRHLDAGTGLPPAPWPGAGAAAAIAGALAADVVAALRGETPPGAGFQAGFEPATWTWTRHPVLPVPRVLEETP